MRSGVNILKWGPWMAERQRLFLDDLHGMIINPSLESFRRLTRKKVTLAVAVLMPRKDVGSTLNIRMH
jgi:hypothetical protein